jgi:membrane-associated phospholipid phosphatase
VAISFVVWLYAYRNSKKLFWILSPLILSLWLSTLYLRYHYLIDVVAGLILAPLSFLLANWLFRRFGEIPVSFTIPASLAEHLPWLPQAPAAEAPQRIEDGR